MHQEHLLTPHPELISPVSHRRLAATAREGQPSPTLKMSRTNQFWSASSRRSAAGVISTHVPAPCSREGMQHASHIVSADSMPPTTWDLQSSTTAAISRHAAYIFPSFASMVFYTESANPLAEICWPSHLSVCASFIWFENISFCFFVPIMMMKVPNYGPI